MYLSELLRKTGAAVRLARTRTTCSLTGVGHAASTAVAARRHVPARRLATVAAAAAPAPEQPTAPAAPALPAQAETLPAVAAIGNEQGQSSRKRDTQLTAGKPRSPPASSSSSSSLAEPEVMSFSSTTDTTSAAAFIAITLLGQPDATLRLNPAQDAGPAGLAALAMLAKAGQILANKDPDTSSTSSSSSSSSPQLTFQIDRRFVRGASSSGSNGAEVGDARAKNTSAESFVLELAPAGSLSADLQSEEEAPMVVQLDTEPLAIMHHALQHMQRSRPAAAKGVDGSNGRNQQQQQAVAAFMLADGQLPARVQILLRGLSNARRKLYGEGKADLKFTVERSVLEMTGDERQQQQAEEVFAAAVKGESGAADVSNSSSSSSSSIDDEGRSSKAAYMIRAYSCKLKLKAGQSGRIKWQQQQQQQQ